jgi:hypothetical protein
VLDLDPSVVPAKGHEADLDICRLASVAAEVPEIAQTRRRLPDSHHSPVMLDTVACPLEDAAPDPALEHHEKVTLA